VIPVSVRSSLGGIRRAVLSTFSRRTAALGTLGPVVSFTFDDFPRSAFSCGADIVESAGARATYYVAMGMMDTVNGLGAQFCRNDLHALAGRGHEIAIHGYRHLSARRTPVSDFVRDVTECREALRHLLESAVSDNFAYPYGEATLASKRVLGPRVASSRGTVPGLNGPDTDLNLLRANPLYGGENEAAAARHLIAENQARRSWLIFYSHDVAEKPSPYGCTPALLRTAVSAAAESGAQLMTVAEVVTRICVTEKGNE
jgi:peptidoglycan/xylan/chitin deacetylase (PgdA/CDA1 family)